MSKIGVSTFVALALLTTAGRPAFAQAQGAGKPQATLYDRLGGAYAIATVVDDFIERLLVNDTLNANPAIKQARDRVPKAGLKFHVTTLVCQVTDGPCRYVGRSMKESHARLNIGEKEWDAMVAEFKVTLDKFSVPANEQQQLIAIVATTKPDIVIGSPARR
jgi:hemoglobin